MNSKHGQILGVLIVLIGCGCAARASSREIVFPFTGGYLVGDPNSLAFTPDGKLGFALLVGTDNVQRKLFSFSVTNSNVVAVVDITSDLAGSGGAGLAPVVSIGLDYQAGLLFVHGTDTATNEKVICFSFDPTGQLTRLWAANYAGPQILSSGTELAFSTDGSRAFIVYSHSERGTVVNRLDLLDAVSGTVLATADLTSSQPLALEFEFPAPLFPASNQIAFNARTGTIADAPIAGFQGGGFQITLKPRRSLEIYNLAADGVFDSNVRHSDS
jgi:DNA-binding beta-propeller fold protein YncE